MQYLLSFNSTKACSLKRCFIVLYVYCRGVTHKNDVLLFCQRRLQEIKMGTVDSVDREGMELMWKYLELLIKQNGVSVLFNLESL